MGPETKNARPSAINFIKRNYWRPLAVLAVVALVYNEDQPAINSANGQNNQNSQPKTLSQTNILLSEQMFDNLVVGSFGISDLLSRPDRTLEVEFQPDISPVIEITDTHLFPEFADITSTGQEQLETGTSQELKAVIDKVSSRPDLFDQRHISDVTIYYPIYKAVADKFGIKWYLLWIVHEAESTVSTNPDAFNGKSGYIGGFSRHPDWKESVVEQATAGLEHLASLPQRDPTDWKEAAFAAWHLTTITKDNTVLGSLRSYSAQGPASYRYRLYLQYQEVFD